MRAFIASAPAGASAAEVTRQVGDLAWSLGLTRPSYQRVRLLLAERRPPRRVTATTAPGVAHFAVRAVDFLYEYPGPGLRNWYVGYTHGS